MRSPFWTSALLTLTTLMASCGGGSPSTPPPPQSTMVTCDSTTLWAAHPSASGRAIPDNNVTGTSVSWDNQNCTLQTVTSATLDICLSHPRTADLSWRISSPGSGAGVTLNASPDWNANGTSCDSGQGKLQRIDFLHALTSTVNTRGIWTLQVKDQNLGDTGTLIQWRVILQGNT